MATQLTALERGKSGIVAVAALCGTSLFLFANCSEHQGRIHIPLVSERQKVFVEEGEAEILNKQFGLLMSSLTGVSYALGVVVRQVSRIYGGGELFPQKETEKPDDNLMKSRIPFGPKSWMNLSLPHVVDTSVSSIEVEPHEHFSHIPENLFVVYRSQISGSDHTEAPQHSAAFVLLEFWERGQAEPFLTLKQTPREEGQSDGKGQWTEIGLADVLRLTELLEGLADGSLTGAVDLKNQEGFKISELTAQGLTLTLPPLTFEVGRVRVSLEESILPISIEKGFASSTRISGLALQLGAGGIGKEFELKFSEATGWSQSDQVLEFVSGFLKEELP